MAHGLALRMRDSYVRHNLDSNRNLPSTAQEHMLVPVDESEELVAVQIIQSWIQVAKNSRNSKMEFLSLLRETLLFILSPDWFKCTKKNDLLYAFSAYYNKFSAITKNVGAIHNSVLQLSNDPWKNCYFNWENLSTGKLSITDKAVISYFHEEPEEIVLARVQLFAKCKKLEAALQLAKLSFLYQSREKRNIADPHRPIKILKNGSISYPKDKFREGLASVDWFITLLNKMDLSSITCEANQLNCHEGVEIICRVKKNPQRKRICFTLLQIFLIQELIKPSDYCCTKKLYSLFCILHKERNSSIMEVSEDAKKIFAAHAPSSSHLYLFVETMWEHFDIKFMSLYVEFYVRGLTADINYLEAVKTSIHSQDLNMIQNHVAFILIKLSTLFNSVEEAVRECTFSAFILEPSKNKLAVLKKLVDISKTKETEKCNSNMDLTFRDCTCNRICNGYCRLSYNDGGFVHPLLKKGIRNIPYSLVKDLVCVLESVRCINFQYNLFNWQSDFPKLVNFLRSSVKVNFNMIESVNVKEIANKLPTQEGDSKLENSAADNKIKKVLTPSALVKRKNSTEDVKSEFLTVAANIEVQSEDRDSKRIKLSHPTEQKSEFLTVAANIEVQSEDRESKRIKLSHPTEHNRVNQSVMRSIPKLKMNDAIEKVIRMSLSNKITQEQTRVFTNALTAKISDLEKETDESNLTNIQNNENSNMVTQKLSESLQKFLPAHLRPEHKSSCNPNTKQDILNDTIIPSVREQHNSKVFYQSFKRPSVLMKAVNEAENLDFPSTNEEHSPVPNLLCVKKDFRTQTSLHIKSVHDKTDNKLLNYPPHKDILQSHKIEGFDYSNQDVLNLSFKHFVNKSSFELPLQKPKHISQLPLDLKCNKNLVDSARDINFPVSKADGIKYNFDNKNHITVAHQNSGSIEERKADRNSVIQHTMQHLGIKIPNQLSVSLNSNAASQLNHISNDSQNLSPFRVEIPSKNIPKQNYLTANLVIPHQPSSNIGSTKASSSDKKDFITIPGILASPSVIRGNPLEMPSCQNNIKVKKVFSTTMKKTYSHPYEIQPNEFLRKTEKVTERETVYQIYKPKTSNHRFSDQHRILNINSSVPTSSSHSVFSKPGNSSNYQIQASTSKKPSTCSFSYRNSAKARQFKPYVNSSHYQEEKVSIRNNPTGTSNSQIKVIHNNSASILKTSLTSSHRIHSSVDNKYNAQVATVSNNINFKDLYQSSSSHPSTSFASSTANVSNLSDNSTNSIMNYDSLFYSNEVLSENDKRTKIFKAVAAPHDSQKQSHDSKVCCSPLEVNPCQSCSLSTESTSVNCTQKNTYTYAPSTDINCSSSQIQDNFYGAKSERKRIAEKAYSLFHYPSEKYVTCEFCSTACAAMEYNSHLQNFHSNEIISNTNIIGQTSNDENMQLLNLDTSLDFLSQNFTKNNFIEINNKNTPENMTSQENQNINNTCMNMINNTSFDQLVDYLHNVENSVHCTTNSPLEISDVLNDDLQNNNLSELKKPCDKIDFSTEKVSLENSLNEADANIDDMINFFSSNNLESKVSSAPEPFIVDKIETVNCAKQLITVQKSEKKPVRKLEKKLFCNKCLRKYSSKGSITKHIKQFHPEAIVKECIGYCPVSNLNLPIVSDRKLNFNDFSSPIEVQDTNISPYNLNQKILTKENYNSYKEASGNNISDKELNNLTKNPDCKNIPFDPFHKKRNLEGCPHCGKMLTKLYMKQHISKMHSNLSQISLSSSKLKANDSSPLSKSSLSSSSSPLIDNASLLSQMCNSAINSTSNLVQDTLDSNTCLSISDAIKPIENYCNTSYDLTNTIKRLNDICETNSVNLSEPVSNYVENMEQDFPHSVVNYNNSPGLDIKLEPDIVNSISNINVGSDIAICYLCSKQFDSQSSLKEHTQISHRNHLLNKSDKNFWTEISQNDVKMPEKICNTYILESNCDLTTKISESVVNRAKAINLVGDISNEKDNSLQDSCLLNKTNAIHLEESSLTTDCNIQKNIENDIHCLVSDTFQCKNSNSLSMSDPNLYDSSLSVNNIRNDIFSLEEESVSNFVKTVNQSCVNNDEYSHQSSSTNSKNEQNFGVQLKSNELIVETLMQDSKTSKSHLKKALRIKSNVKICCKFCLKPYFRKTHFANHLKLKHDISVLNDNLKMYVFSNNLDEDKISNSPSDSERSELRPSSNTELVQSTQITNLGETNTPKINVKDPFNKKAKYNDKITCVICCKAYSNRGNLKTHMKNIHKYHSKKKEKISKTVQCPVCLKLLSRSSMKTHFKAAHDDGLINDDQNIFTVSTIAKLSSYNYCKESKLNFTDNISSCNVSKDATSVDNHPSSNKANIIETKIDSLPVYDIPSSACSKDLNLSSSPLGELSISNENSSNKKIEDRDGCNILNTSSKNLVCNDTLLKKEFYNEDSNKHENDVELNIDSQNALTFDSTTDKSYFNKDDYLKEVCDKDMPQSNLCDNFASKELNVTDNLINALETSCNMVLPKESNLDAVSNYENEHKDKYLSTDENNSKKSETQFQSDNHEPEYPLNKQLFIDNSEPLESENCNQTQNNTFKNDSSMNCLYEIEKETHNSSIPDSFESKFSLNRSDSSVSAAGEQSYEIPFFENNLNPVTSSNDVSELKHQDDKVFFYGDIASTQLTGTPQVNSEIQLPELKLSNPSFPISEIDETQQNTSNSVLNKSSITHSLKVLKDEDVSKLKEKEAKCRLCHKKFKAMKFLSKHLKIAHKIPFLKKQKTSNFMRNNLARDENKLSPPLLSHQNYDSDSSSTVASNVQSQPDILNLMNSSDPQKINQNLNSFVPSVVDSEIFSQSIDVQSYNISNSTNFHKDVGINCEIDICKRNFLESDISEVRFALNLVTFEGESNFVHADESFNGTRHVGVNCDITCKQTTINENVPTVQSCSKARVLPCIIKICKEGDNSTYRIRNSSKDLTSSAFEKNSDVTKPKSSHCVKKFKINQNAIKYLRFKNTQTSAAYSSYFKKKIYSRNSFFSVKSYNSFCKNKRCSTYKSTTNFLKKIVLPEVRNKSRTLHSALSYSYPVQTTNFLKHHRQPVVCLERLNEKVVQSYLKNNLKYQTGDKSVIVKLEKLDLSTLKRPLHSVPTNVFDFVKTSNVNTLKNNIDKTLKPSLLQNPSSQERNDDFVELHKIQDTSSIYIEKSDILSNYPDIAKILFKKINQLPTFKECKVVLNKLSL